MSSVSIAGPVTIIGGGIGGLAVANALQRVGANFAVYERAPILTEVGAGIGLSPAALRVLDALGLGTQVRAQGFEVRHARLADKRLHVRRELPIAPGSVCVHRAALLDILKGGLPPEKIHLGRRAVSVDTKAGEVAFHDGSRVAAPCVVVADGIQSALRQAVFPDVRVRYIDQTIWRGIADIEVPDVLRGGFVEIWAEGLRFLTVPMDARRTLWLAVKPEVPGGKDDPATVRERLAALFAGYHPVAGDLIRGTRGKILRGDMADLGAPRRSWHAGRVVFVGDAIHATTPNLAQGGCQAIEDALALALCLRTFENDLAAAFEACARLRRPKAAFVVRTSWALGRAAHARNPLHHYGYRAVLKWAPAAFLRRQDRLLNDLTYLREVDADGILPDLN
ncbi:MAG: FAD-dependent monooxygenase [Chthoniobacterales bacterium]